MSGRWYADHLIDTGYYDITPEQERELEGRDCPVCGGDCAGANPPVYNCPNGKRDVTEVTKTAERIIQSVCELQELPPITHPETIIINVNDLRTIIENHLEAVRQRQPTPTGETHETSDRECSGSDSHLVGVLQRIERGARLQANVMRDPLRTGGWAGAEKVADAFDDIADRAQDAAPNTGDAA